MPLLYLACRAKSSHFAECPTLFLLLLCKCNLRRMLFRHRKTWNTVLHLAIVSPFFPPRTLLFILNDPIYLTPFLCNLFGSTALLANCPPSPLFLFHAPFSLSQKFIEASIKCGCCCSFTCLLLLLSQDGKALLDECW